MHEHIQWYCETAIVSRIFTHSQGIARVTGYRLLSGPEAEVHGCHVMQGFSATLQCYLMSFFFTFHYKNSCAERDELLCSPLPLNRLDPADWVAMEIGFPHLTILKSPSVLTYRLALKRMNSLAGVLPADWVGCRIHSGKIEKLAIVNHWPRTHMDCEWIADIQYMSFR